jgi:hypothetical protein
LFADENRSIVVFKAVDVTHQEDKEVAVKSMLRRFLLSRPFYRNVDKNCSIARIRAPFHLKGFLARKSMWSVNFLTVCSATQDCEKASASRGDAR